MAVPDEPTAPEPVPYEPPTIERLGTLAELTMGGSTGPPDSLSGAAGSSDSL